MNEYFLNSKELYELFKENNIDHIYHADTVTTSKTFLSEKSFLSRNQLEKLNLPFTHQRTDTLDKKLGISKGIFLDFMDIHKERKDYNFYGPVLFKINLDILLNAKFSKVLITKSNPQHWTPETPENQRYIESLSEFEENLEKLTVFQNAGSMLIFFPDDEKMSLSFLKEVLVDNPDIRKAGKQISDVVAESLKEELVLPFYKEVQRKFRNCKKGGCNCVRSYSDIGKKEFRKLFKPNEI